jgi:hypothetical protein
VQFAASTLGWGAGCADIAGPPTVQDVERLTAATGGPYRVVGTGTAGSASWSVIAPAVGRAPTSGQLSEVSGDTFVCVFTENE